MANKRLAELNTLSSTTIAANDLLLVSDFSAQESKQITVDEFNLYILNNGNITASVLGTASYAVMAKTASFISNVPSASYALTCSYALNSSNLSNSSSWASSSLSSSIAITASYVSSSVASISASYSNISKFSNSASYIIYTEGTNNGTVFNAINALTANATTNATFSLQSTYATSSISASYALTASNSLVALTAITASTSTTALNAITASRAITASYTINSLSSSYSLNSNNALTASLGVITTINYQSSASWASSSISSSYAATAYTSRYATSASYTTPNFNLIQYGIFPAITQSTVISQLDKITFSGSSNNYATASIGAVGTIIAQYTSSIPLNENINLYLMNRSTGIKTLLDSTPIYVYIQGQVTAISASINANIINGSITGSMTGSITGSSIGITDGILNSYLTGSVTGSSIDGDITASLVNGYYTGSMTSSFTGTNTGLIDGIYNGYISGSMTGSVSTFMYGIVKIPYSLMGQNVVETGNYIAYVTSSSPLVSFEPSRLTKFEVNNNNGSINVSVGEQIVLRTHNPNETIMFISTDGGPFMDTAANMVISGSDKMLIIDASGVGSIQNVWTLNNLRYIRINSNPFITNVGGMPESIVTMSISNCLLNTLSALSHTSASRLDVSINQLTSLPLLPSTMSYINCSNNPLTTLPSALPSNLVEFYCDSTSITSLPGGFPNTIVTMSLANNSNLGVWTTPLPTSLKYFNVSNSPNIISLPTIPSGVLYLNIVNCNMNDTNIGYICDNLVSNALNSGSFLLYGNSTPSGTTLSKIATLQSRAWAVTYV